MNPKRKMVASSGRTEHAVARRLGSTAGLDRATGKDIVLARSQAPRTGGTRRRRPNTKRAGAAKTNVGSSGAGAARSKKNSNISQLFTPKNLQETVKTVTSLRGMVKNWLGYLQQADRMLDTVYVTTGSLRESGVLDKILKNRGRNLTTEDYTSILAALMASPLGSGLLKGGGGNDEDGGNGATERASAPSQPAQRQPQQQQGPAYQPGYPQQQPSYQQQPGPYQPPAQPGYGQPYAQPNYGQPSYGPPPAYPAPGYGMPSYGQPNTAPSSPSQGQSPTQDGERTE